MTTTAAPPGLDPKNRVDLIEVFNNELRSAEFQRREGSEVAQIDDLKTIYHSTILKLETSFAQQIQKITSWTVEQTSALEQQKIKLADDTNAERERLSKEYEAKTEALRVDIDALEQKRRDLDDRTHMHARRGIHDDLRKTIKARQERFTLTPETRRLRYPVHIALSLLLLVLAAANIATLQTILNLDLDKATVPALVWAFGKQSILTALFVGVIFFYVRWMNRWFEQHASAEFLLKQFELDIDRASWVVETAMEWRRNQQEELPTPLLDGITRNLFSDRTDLVQSHSAADDLASALVGNASQVKLKIGENEVSLDRKGIAELGKTEVSAKSA